MSAIQRNNAVPARNLGGVRLGGGGGGAARATRQAAKVKRRVDVPADPAAELMPAAEFLGHETDFAAILERFPDSPFDPARRKILGRLMGMFAMDYQGANPEERRFLKRLLSGHNAREGYVANRSLHLCGAPHVIRRTLALGVAEARFATRPTHGFLGAVQARTAVTTFRMLGPKARETVWNLLTLAGGDARGRPQIGADRLLERALVLKALAARRHRLGPWSADGPRAVDEVATFAVELRGAGRAVLAARTTLFPGDPSRVAPRLAAPTGPGARAVLLAQGEVDPVFAWSEHGRKRDDLPGGQSAEVGDEAFPDLDRSPLQDRPRLHQALAEARAKNDPDLDLRSRDALTDYLAGRELSDNRLALKDQALAVLGQRGFDVIRLEAVEAMREDARGVYRFDAARALGDLMSRYTGAAYVRRLFSDQITAGADPLGQIVHAVQRGLAVPITVNELKSPTSHAFAAVSARGEAETTELGLRPPAETAVLNIGGKALLGLVLPETFGRKARADLFMAPAALDLLAPPFGIPFPELGIEDRL